MKDILVVEDDRLLGKVVSEKLMHAGYVVWLAKNAREAEKMINDHDIGLAFLDVRLPGDVDGFEILRAIKQNDDFKQIPVVMLTNEGELQKVEKGMDLGAVDYIVKAATDLNKLPEVVERWIIKEESK